MLLVLIVIKMVVKGKRREKEKGGVWFDNYMLFGICLIS